MAHRKEKKLEKQRSRDAPVVPHGKQTVKQLGGQNQGISNIEITDPYSKEFEKIARKYGVDYAVKKDRSSSPPVSYTHLDVYKRQVLLPPQRLDRRHESRAVPHADGREIR